LIDKLEFLLALSREQHFGRAAETCGVTQPTLSAGVKQLEDTLGVRIVNRGSRFQGFTAEGERVLDWARRIVGDARAMRQEIDGLKRGLTGHLRIAAIPTALPIVASLTTPFRQRHPDVHFSVLSRTSAEILALIENVEVDAGLTYLDNEPLGRVKSLPLYREDYVLLTVAGGALASATEVSWAEAGKLPLCLLSRDMQNRRIIDSVLQKAGVEETVALETDSLTVLASHIRTGRWSSIVPKRLAETLGIPPAIIRTIPLVDPIVSHTIGLVVPAREPMTPVTAAFFSEARHLGSAGIAAAGRSEAAAT
jgi:DNA-binding transcriptional LysR family regulator